MKIKVVMVAVCFMTAGVLAGAQKGQSHLMRFADVHRDAVVFTYEGDLWRVPSQGGDAVRITNDPGQEQFAKFSPDGTKIAFTANYDGGTDVYVMDARGGVPIRLTYHPAGDYVLGWYPDGRHILFRSNREYPDRGMEIYKVSVDGGMPEKLPVDRAGLTALSPDASKIAYNRIDREFRTWKRHQGGTAQDIWMGSLAKGDFHRITDWKGTDSFPMWQGDFIYFLSDRDAGTLNIFSYDVGSGKITALTHYTDYDVKYPSIGPGAIVYQYGESLYILDLASGKARMVDVRIPSDRVPMKAEYVDPARNTGAFGLSPDGDRLLLESRGEILVVPADKEDGPSENLTRTSGSREKDCAWSPDGKHVAFISDKTGEEELYLAEPGHPGDWKALTKGNKGYRMHLVWSPDSKFLLFGDKYMRLNLLDVATGALTVVDRGHMDDGWDRWGIQDYVFSPDSRWIAYTKMMDNTNEVIYLYALDSRKSVPVTDDTSESWSPSFDPQGRYLYFLSNRTFKPLMGTVDQDHVFLKPTLPYVVVLKKGQASPFDPQAGEAITKADKGKISATAIDPGDFSRRTVPAEGVKPGSYFRLEATDNGFLYLSMPEAEFPQRYAVVTDKTSVPNDLYAYDLKDRKAAEVMKGIENYHLSADGKKLVYHAGKTFGIVKAGTKAKVGEGAVDLAAARFRIERMPEFRQMFNEAWRIERDWFYDPNMQGNDWKAIHDKYGRFLPNCGNRSDLNYIIGEMIAELDIGHTYVYGGDYRERPERIGTGLLGCDFATPAGSAFHRIAHVVPGKPWSASLRSPLAAPGCPIREGDYLIAVDGEKVPATDNVYKYLDDRAGRLVTLTYNSKPTPEGAKTWRVRTLRSEWPIRYQEWVDGRAAEVAKLSNGTVGYIHLSDMMQGGLVEFAKAFYPQRDMKALLIDVRYNGGGFVGDMIIDRLERAVWAFTQPREGRPGTNPEMALRGHLALLINADTGSNGEFFAEAIKVRKLARVFGMRTWGGSVGIEPHQDLVDGGAVTPPQFGLYGANGAWLIEGHGVDPDVTVENMPADVLKGRDPQLETAVKYLLEELKKAPMAIPAHPPYPDKARPHGSDQMH
jgi:tricorn protease